MFKPIRIRDRKAPRFRWSKTRHIVLNRDLFESYKTSVENPIQDYSLFKDIIEDFSELLKQKTMSNRDGVKLPAYMGILAICSYKPRRRVPVDWAASEGHGVKLKEYNLHTAGLSCKIVYSVYTAKYKFRNWALWRFEGNRNFTNRVSNAFIENYQYYKRLDNKSHVSKMFRENYITDVNYGSIRTDIEHKGDEQTTERGQSDNGQIYIQRGYLNPQSTDKAGGH